MKYTPAEANSTQSSADNGEKESCRSCLYTGVATCFGLSAYFLNLAFEDPPSQQNNDNNITTAGKNASRITKARNAHKLKDTTTMFDRKLKYVQQKNIPKSNKQFHIAFSAAWAIAGIYRLYLN